MATFTLTYPNLTAWCDRQQFQYLTNPQAGQLAILYKILGADAPLQLLPYPERSMLTLAVSLPFAVPQERYAAIKEALTQLNSRSYMGSWVLNPDKAEIYFRVTLPTLDNEYSDPGLLFVARVVIGSAESAAAPLYRIAQQGEDQLQLP